MTRRQELRWLRDKYGLTYRQLAKLAGLSNSSAEDWSKNTPKKARTISLGALNRIKDALAEFEFQQNNERVDLPWLMHIPREEYDLEPLAFREAQAKRTAKYLAARARWDEVHASRKKKNEG